MKRAAFLAFLCLVSAAPGLALARPHHAATHGAALKTPVVVELFTAQGCSTCGKANAFVGGLADRADVIALTWSVDYWDYTGWKDTFARPEFADRQRAYERHFNLRDVYTPQVVVGGAAQTTGARPDAVEKLIKDARHAGVRGPGGQFVRGDKIYVSAGRVPLGGAEVWLVRYDPREQDVEVKDGDNRGHTVAHRNVVRQLERLGAWHGKAATYRLPAPSDDGLRTLVLVQGVKGGRVVAAFRAPKS